MPKSRKSIPRVLPLISVAAFIPSLVIAARGNNTYILSMVIPAIAVVLVFDVVALLLMRKAKVVGSGR